MGVKVCVRTRASLHVYVPVTVVRETHGIERDNTAWNSET